MDLINFDLVGAVLRVLPSDCAKLARFCELAEGHLCSPEDEPAADAARAFGALFRACAMGATAAGELMPGKWGDLAGDLAALGLGDLVNLPEGRSGA